MFGVAETVDLRFGAFVVPVVADNAVHRGPSAGDQCGVSGPGFGVGVCVARLRIVRAGLNELRKAPLKVWTPPFEGVGGELVDDHEHGQTGGWIGKRPAGQEGEPDREQDPRNLKLQHVRI